MQVQWNILFSFFFFFAKDYYKDQHYSNAKQGFKLDTLKVGGPKAPLFLLDVNFAVLAQVFETYCTA